MASGLVERLQRVGQDFAQQHLAEQQLPDEQRALHAAGRHALWLFAAFRDLKRDPPPMKETGSCTSRSDPGTSCASRSCRARRHDGRRVKRRARHRQGVVVAAPIETVWQTWTSKRRHRSFFAPDAEIDPRVGGAFHIHMDPLAEPGMKGADDMRFMALQPPTMLSFDWNAPPSLPECARAADLRHRPPRRRRRPLDARDARIIPAGASAANGTRRTPTSIAPGATCSAT